jgi:hypothetical protein
MNFSDMQQLLRFLVDDTVEAGITATLLNMGQNEMATAVKCDFPQLSSDVPSGTFVFPEKFHKLPVFYAAAMYKGYDSSVREKDSYMADFQNGLPNFTENYTPPYRYWDDFNVQQFRAVDSVFTYNITKDGYDRRYADLRIYVNDVPVKASTSTTDNTFTIDSSVGLVSGDYITVIWEIHADLVSPPHEWWRYLP